MNKPELFKLAKPSSKLQVKSFLCSRVHSCSTGATIKAQIFIDTLFALSLDQVGVLATQKESVLKRDFLNR